MLSLRTNYRLKDLSQGSRIAYVRHFRGMTQHNVADKLGVKRDNKRRIMTRYEKGERNPKEDRTKEIAKKLNVSYSSIKQYDFKNINDIFYVLMWMGDASLVNDIAHVTINGVEKTFYSFASKYCSHQKLKRVGAKKQLTH